MLDFDITIESVFLVIFVDVYRLVGDSMIESVI